MKADEKKQMLRDEQNEFDDEVGEQEEIIDEEELSLLRDSKEQKKEYKQVYEQYRAKK